MATESERLNEIIAQEMKSRPLLKIDEDFFAKALDVHDELGLTHRRLYHDHAPQSEIDKAGKEQIDFWGNLCVYKKLRESKIIKLRAEGIEEPANITAEDLAPSSFHDVYWTEKRRKHDLSIFENHSYSTVLLIRAYQHPGLTKKEMVGLGSSTAKYNTLDALERAGLISTDKKNRIHQTQFIYVTDKGSRIAEHLVQIAEIMKEGDYGLETV